MSLWSAAAAAAAASKSLQSCPTLCDPIDSSPLGSPVPGILQARTLEWVAISFSKAWKWKMKVKSLSRVWLSVTPWTAAYHAPPPMGFSRQEYWSGVPSPFLHCLSWFSLNLKASATPSLSYLDHSVLFLRSWIRHYYLQEIFPKFLSVGWTPLLPVPIATHASLFLHC